MRLIPQVVVIHWLIVIRRDIQLINISRLVTHTSITMKTTISNNGGMIIIGCDNWQRGKHDNPHFEKENVDVGFSLYWWRSELMYNWSTPLSQSLPLGTNAAGVQTPLSSTSSSMSISMGSGRMDEALEYAQQSQPYAHDERLRCDAANLAKLLYNKGIAQYNRRDFLGAIQWLHMSHKTLECDMQSSSSSRSSGTAGIAIGVGVSGNSNSDRQCRTWRVISLAHMELQQYEEALYAIERSLTCHPNDCDGIFVKAKCFYELKRPAADDTLFELIHNTKAPLQMYAYHSILLIRQLTILSITNVMG
jgi:tetratricopeptide (TPR) repeat protein